MPEQKTTRRMLRGSFCITILIGLFVVSPVRVEAAFLLENPLHSAVTTLGILLAEGAELLEDTSVAVYTETTKAAEMLNTQLLISSQPASTFIGSFLCDFWSIFCPQEAVPPSEVIIEPTNTPSAPLPPLTQTATTTIIRELVREVGGGDTYVTNTYPTTYVTERNTVTGDYVTHDFFNLQVDAIYDSMTDGDSFNIASESIEALADVATMESKATNDLLSFNGTEWTNVATSSLGFGSSNFSTTEIDTSAELAAILTDETGTGNIVFSAGPTFTGTTTIATLALTNALTVPNGGTGATSLTGLVLGNGTAAFTATTTSLGLASILSDETGSGSLVFSASPTFTGTTTIANASTTNLTITGTTYFPSGIWNSSGNVGVGTTSPSSRLTVQASSGAASAFAVYTASSTSIFNIENTPVVAGGDISTASSTDNLSLTVTGGFVQDLYMKSDGTRLYVISLVGSDAVYEFALGTAWNISSASLTASTSVATQEGNSEGLFFSSDGTKMYTTGTSNDRVNMYTLSTPWSVSSAAFTASTSVAAQDTDPQGVSFSADGTKMYIVGDAGNDINQYNLSSAWDVTTASFVQSFSVNGQTTSPSGVFLNSNGTKMYVTGGITSDSFEYDLSTAWDISSAEYIQNHTDGGEGIFLSVDGSKLYILTSQTNLRQYDLDYEEGWLATAAYLKVGGSFFDGTDSAGTSGMLLQTTGTSTQWVNSWVTSSTTVSYSLGNVGIGTTSPQSLLHVESSSGDLLTLQRDHATCGASLQLFNATLGTDGWQIKNSTSGCGSTLGSLHFIEKGTDERLSILAGGNVGIGTTTPTHTLDVASLGHQLLSVQRTSGQEGKYYFQITSSYGGDSSSLNIVNAGTAGDIVLRASSSGDGQFIVQNNGNVGIGTTDPGAKLDIIGTGDGTKLLRFGMDRIWCFTQRGADSSAYLTLESDCGGTNYKTFQVVAGVFTVGTTAGSPLFSVDGTTGNVSLVLSTSGTTNNAVCWDNSGATLLYDCDSTPADYAESYPVDEKVPFGTILMATEEQVIQTDGEKVPRLTKAVQNEGPILGIASNNYHDFTSAGLDLIKPEDNPMPVALNGRVPVKVNLEGGDIEIGDQIALSSIPGVGKKAEHSGETTVGIALASYDEDTSGDTVLVFVENSRWESEASLAIASLFEEDLSQNASSTFEMLLENDTDTIWTRLVMLAQNFVDGVLTLAGIKTDQVETERLCVGDICVTEDEFRSVFSGEAQSAGVHEADDSEESAPTPDTASEVPVTGSAPDESLPNEEQASSTPTITEPEETDTKGTLEEEPEIEETEPVVIPEEEPIMDETPTE